jgi:ubiquinol-cytochrome c reductase iron-sulfur subunit
MPERGRRWRLSQRERFPATAFAASILASIGLAVVYWQGGQTQAEGILLAIVLGGIGIGLAGFAKRFLPPGPDEEPRPPVASSDADVAAFVSDFQHGGEELARRGFLVKLMVGAVGALGLAALFPIRSLGPRPGQGLKETPYRKGVRIVTEDGDPVLADELAVDGVITVYPEGHIDDADAPTLLLRLAPGRNNPAPGRADWVVVGPSGDLVAYSKLCTHLGCPVGLFQAQEGLLLCPCHQSTFDVPDHCRPIFGPATRSLPQLPLGVDADGFLVAEGDFSGPVGAGFWDRGR